MSKEQLQKRIFWVIFVFIIVLLVGAYLFLLKLEESQYNDFINKEWTANVISYTNENSPLVGDYIRNLTTDNDGQIWIGTDDALNVVTQDGSWKIYTRTKYGLWKAFTNDKDDRANIQSVAIDRLERIWVGTFDGLYALDPNEQWTTYDEDSKTVYEHYTSSKILVDRFDRIWVANNDGLRMFLPDGTKTFYTKENSGLPDNYITALAEDRSGNIWIGTRIKGIVVFDHTGQWRTYQANEPENGLVENRVTSILIDDQDRVWVGTKRHGISMLSPNGNWTTYDVTHWGIQKDPVYYDREINALAMDEMGRLWIGTADTLFAFDIDTGDWITYTSENSGLRPSHIKALTIDGRGRLWIATFHDVFVLDIQKELPKTVSSEWLLWRNRMFIPLEKAKSFWEWVFFPTTVFYASPFCNLVYIAMLILIIPLGLRIRKNIKDNNENELKKTVWSFILVIAGIIFYRFIAFVAAIIPT